MAETNFEKLLNVNLDKLEDQRDIEDISFILEQDKISLKNIFTVYNTVPHTNQDSDIVNDNEDIFTDINITNIDNNVWNLDKILQTNLNKLNQLFKTRSGHFSIIHQANVNKLIKEKISPLEIEIERQYIDNFFINDENSIITINSLKIKDQNDIILSEINGKNFSGYIHFNNHLNLTNKNDNVFHIEYLSEENVHQNLIGFKKKNIENTRYEDNYITNDEDKIKISFISHILEDLTDAKIELDFNILTPYQYESTDSQVQLPEIRDGIIEGLRSDDFENGRNIVGDNPRQLNIQDINAINNIINEVDIVGESTTVLTHVEIENINKIINGEEASLIEENRLTISQIRDINTIINTVIRDGNDDIILTAKEIEDINEIINDIPFLIDISKLTSQQEININKITQLIEDVFRDKNISHLSPELFDQNDGLLKRLEESNIGPIISSSTNTEGINRLKYYINKKISEIGSTSELKSLDYKFSLLFNSLNLNHYTKIDFTNIKNESGIHIEDQDFYNDNDVKFKLTHEKEVKVSRLKVLVDFAKIKDNKGYVKFRDQNKLNDEDDVGELYIDINKSTLEPTGDFIKGRVIDIQPNITKHISLTDTSTSRINLKPKIITNENTNIDQYGNKTLEDGTVVKLKLYTDELINIDGELVQDYFEKHNKIDRNKIDTTILESKEREIRNMLIHDVDILLNLKTDENEDIDLKLLNLLDFVNQNEFNVAKIKNRTTRASLNLLNEFIKKYNISILNFEDSSISDSNEVRNIDIETKLTAIVEYIVENNVTSTILKEIDEIYRVTHDRLGYNNDNIYNLLNNFASLINENVIKEPFIDEYKLSVIKNVNKNILSLNDKKTSSDFFVNSIKLSPIDCDSIKMLDNNILNIENVLPLNVTTDIDEGEDDKITEIICSPNALPVANAGDDKEVLSGLKVVLDGSRSYSPEGDIVSYLWEEVKETEDNIFTTVDDDINAIQSTDIKTIFTTDDLEPGSSYLYRSFQLTVTNDSGETDSDIITITIQSPNAPPRANAGNDRLVLSGSTVELDGSRSKDTDIDREGIIDSYTWKRIGGTGNNSIQLNNYNIVNPTFTADTLEDGDISVTHIFELIVRDNLGELSDPDQVTITVQSNNILPVAHAGFDQVVDAGDTVILDGSRSSDKGFESGIIGYSWGRIGGTDGVSVTLSDELAIKPEFTTSPLAAGAAPVIHEFSLVVFDTRGDISEDTVIITVISPNLAPVANAGPDQNNIKANQTVQLDGSASHDPGYEGKIISYLWERIGGTGNENIIISDPNIVNPTFVTEDLEPGLKNVTHIFRLTVTDNRASVKTDDNEPLTDTDEVMITVISDNIKPVADAGGPSRIVNPVDTITLDGSGSYDKGYGSGITSYSWKRIGGTGDSSITLQNANTETPSFVTESLKVGSPTVSHIFELTVTDTNGATDTDIITILIDAPNAPPVAEAGTDQTVFSGTVVELDGSGSYDIEDRSSELTYTWTHVGSTLSRTVTLTNPNTFNPSFTTDILEPGHTDVIDVFELRVTDSEGASHRDVTVITTQSENLPPIANAGSYQSVDSETLVTLDGSKSLDRDGSIVSYYWEKRTDITGVSNVDIELSDPNAVNPTFTSDTLVAGADSIKHVFRLTVTDNNGDIGWDETTIVVNSPNAGPTVIAGDDIVTTSGSIVNLNATAADVDGTVDSYLWEEIGGSGADVTLSDPNIVNPTFTAPTLIAGLDPITYIFQITVEDNNGAKATDSLLVTITSPNVPPVSVPGTLQRVSSGSRVELDGSASYDTGYNSSISEYSWTSDSNNEPNIILVNANRSKASFIAPQLEAGVEDVFLYFNLEVTDNNNETNTEKTCVIVESPNLGPEANAGGDQVVNYGSTVTLDGSKSIDRDDQITSYRWRRIGGSGDPSITLSNTAKPTFIADILSVGVSSVDHIFELTVTDTYGATDIDTVMVIVIPPKDPPIANAGINQRVEQDTLVQLDGSDSYDKGYNSGIVSYRWEIISSNSEIELSNTDIVNPTFTSDKLDIDATAIEHSFKLTVTDRAGETDSDTVTILVEPPNDPPKAVAKILIDGEYKDSAYVSSETEVTLDGTKSSDTDGTITSYSWVRSGGTAGQNVVLTNANTASPTFTTEALDPGASFITHIFKLTVSDGDDVNTDYVTVIVESPNSTPIANAGNNQVVISGNQVQLDGSGSHDPGPSGDIVKYLWEWVEEGSSGNPHIALSDPNIVNPTFIADNLIPGSKSITHRFKLTVTDDRGGTDNDIVVIIIESPNAPPVAIANILIRDRSNTNTFSTALQKNATVDSASTVTLDGSRSYDIDGTISSYSWERIGGTGSDQIVLSDPNVANPTFVADNIEKLNSSLTHVFKLTVTDNEGLINTDTIVVSVKAQNSPPIAVVTEDYLVITSPNIVTLYSNTENRITVSTTPHVTLDGWDSYDPDGALGLRSYGWELLNKNELPTDYVYNPSSTYAVLEPEIGPRLRFKPPILEPGTPSVEMKFRLTVTDDDDAIGTKDVRVIVQSPNIGPSAYAGEDQIVDHNTQVTLDGSNSRDYGVGYIKSYSWKHKSAMPELTTIPTLSSNDQSIVSFISDALSEGSEDVIHLFELTVTDDRDISNTDIVQIRVKAPVVVKKPIIRAHAYVTDLELNNIQDPGYVVVSPKVRPGTIVKLYGRAYDPNRNINFPDDEVSYHWERISGTNHEVPLIEKASTRYPRFTANKLEQNEFEACHVFRFTVTDNEGNKYSDDITVIIEVPNIPPTANAGKDQDVIQGSKVTLDGSGSYDSIQGEIGHIVSYRWERIGGSSNNDIKLQNETEKTANFTAETLMNGEKDVSHNFLLTVTDDRGLTDTDVITINVKAPRSGKIGPIAYAGNHIYANLGDTVQLNGYGSFVRPGKIVSYHWEKAEYIADNDNIELSDPNIVNPTFVANRTGYGNYAFKLTVTDSEGKTDSDYIGVSRRNPKQTSIANAGPDQIVQNHEIVKLNGLRSQSNKNLRDISFYSWERIDGSGNTNNVDLKDANTATPTFKAIYEYSKNTSVTHIFELTVIDSVGNKDKDIVVISIVNDTSIPVANAGISQNVNHSTKVQLDGSESYIHTQINGEIVSYQWDQILSTVRDTKVNLINANTATPHFISASSGYYVHNFRLTITDSNGNADTDSVTVSVNNINEPVIIDIGPDRVVEAGDTVDLIAYLENDTTGDNVYDWDIYMINNLGSTLPVIKDDNKLKASFKIPDTLEPNLPYVKYGITFDVRKQKTNIYRGHERIEITAYPKISQTKTLFANAGTSQIGYFNSTIQLHGSDSITHDPDRRIISYKWKRIGGSKGSIIKLSNPNIPNPTFISKSITTGSPYIRYHFRLTVTDDIGNTDTDDVLIIAYAPRSYPGINLGNIQSITSGTEALINISTDLLFIDINEDNKDRYTYEWERIGGSGNSNIVLKNKETSSPTLVADILEKGSDPVTHIFKLTIRLKGAPVHVLKTTIVVTSEKKDDPSITTTITDMTVPFINRIIPSRVHYTPTPKVYPIVTQSGYTYYRALILTHGISRNNILYRGLNNHISGFVNRNANLKRSTQNLNINDIKHILNESNFNSGTLSNINFESYTYFNYESYPVWVRIKDDKIDIRQSGKFIISPNNQNGHIVPISSTDFKKISYRENYGFDLGNGNIDRFQQGSRRLLIEESNTPAWVNMFNKPLPFFGTKINSTYLNKIHKYNEYTYFLPIEKWPIAGQYSSKLITVK